MLMMPRWLQACVGSERLPAYPPAVQPLHHSVFRCRCCVFNVFRRSVLGCWPAKGSAKLATP